MLKKNCKLSRQLLSLQLEIKQKNIMSKYINPVTDFGLKNYENFL